MKYLKTKQQFFTIYLQIASESDERVEEMYYIKKDDVLDDILTEASETLSSKDYCYLNYELGLITITEAIFRWTIDLEIKKSEGLLYDCDVVKLSTDVMEHIKSDLNSEQKKSLKQKLELYSYKQELEYMM